jgi:imidazole glycerol-phosphate synthase subunit HisH
MLIIVDYKAGNLTSVQLAFASLGVESRLTSEPEDVLSAERIVFPGDGAAGSAMANLKQLKLVDAIKRQITNGVPFLGICIGMQLLFDSSEENGGTPCLGILPGKVKRFTPAKSSDKVPQMGWNQVNFKIKHPVFKDIDSGSDFYFVHGYYPVPAKKQYIFAETEYAGITFASISGKNNLIATQFHPEKSGRIGLKLLDNFLHWNGLC